MASRKSPVSCVSTTWKARCSRRVVFRNFAASKKRPDPVSTTGTTIEAPKRSESGMVYTFSCSTEYYNTLCRALKLRYWLDLGNDNAFTIDWQDIKDNTGAFVEHIIKVAGIDGNENVQNLYTITLYNTKAKVMIQGNCREDWVMQEFPKFKLIIDAVLIDGTSLRDAYNSHIGKAIDFQDNDLLFSDCEDGEADLQSTSSPKKTVIKKRKLVSPRIAQKNTKRQSGNNLEHSEADQLHNIEDRIESLENCIRSHDLSALAADLSSLNFEEGLCRVTKDFDTKLSSISAEVRGLRDELITAVKNSVESSLRSIITDQMESFRSEFMSHVSVLKQEVEDLKVKSKNELGALHQSVKDSLLEGQTTVKQTSDEVNKLRARGDALSDKLQHSSQQMKNFQDRISLLESSNDSLVERMATLENHITVASSDRNNGTQEKEADCLDNGSLGTGPSTAMNRNTNAETDPRMGGKNNPAEIVILMDSNRRFLDLDKLSSNKNIKIMKCATIVSARAVIEKSRLKNPQILVFHTGVNDVESSDDAGTIANMLTDAIFFTKEQFPTAKIVVSEITPRCDELNHKVDETNIQLRLSLENCENVFLVPHDNLKDPRCFSDVKHVNDSVGIAKLASNLVKGIRLARGLTAPRPRKRKSTLPPRQKNNQQPGKQVPITPPMPPRSQHEDNINLMKEVLHQLQVNGSLLSGLASSRQIVQGAGAPAYPQTIYPLIRPTMTPQPMY